MTEKIASNFDIRLNEPIDVRYTIPTLTQQVDISVRYVGLIFYVKDIKQVYIYQDNLNAPIPFSDYLYSQNVDGKLVTDYSKLDEILAPYSKLGKLITIFPLGVTYMFNGAIWEYFDGIYEVETEAIFNTIPKKYVADKVKVTIGTGVNKLTKITLVDGTLSDEIIVIGDTEPTLIDGRFYTKYGNLYYCIGGVLFNVGSRENVLINYNVINGINTVTHNLNSSNLSVTLLASSMDLITQVTMFQSVDDNSFKFESYCDIPDASLIVKTI